MQLSDDIECRSRVVLMIGDVIVWNSGRLSNYSNEAKKPKQCSSVCQGGHQPCSQAPLSTLSTVVQDPSCFTSLNIKHPVKSLSKLDWTVWTGSVCSSSWNIICVGGDTTWDPPQHHSSDNSSARTRPRTSALAVTGLRITSAAPCPVTCHESLVRAEMTGVNTDAVFWLDIPFR